MRKHDRTVNLPAATAELSDDGLVFNAQVRSGLLVRDVPPISYPFMKIVHAVGFRMCSRQASTF